MHAEVHYSVHTYFARCLKNPEKHPKAILAGGYRLHTDNFSSPDVRATKALWKRKHLSLTTRITQRPLNVHWKRQKFVSKVLSLYPRNILILGCERTSEGKSETGGKDVTYHLPIITTDRELARESFFSFSEN